jgi:hypothetical protein
MPKRQSPPAVTLGGRREARWRCHLCSARRRCAHRSGGRNALRCSELPRWRAGAVRFRRASACELPLRFGFAALMRHRSDSPHWRSSGSQWWSTSLLARVGFVAVWSKSPPGAGRSSARWRGSDRDLAVDRIHHVRAPVGFTALARFGFTALARWRVGADRIVILRLTEFVTFVPFGFTALARFGFVAVTCHRSDSPRWRGSDSSR